jgi:hypothetical protein
MVLSLRDVRREKALSASYVVVKIEATDDKTEKCMQSLNPGNLKSDLQRHMPGWQAMLLVSLRAAEI